MTAKKYSIKKLPKHIRYPIEILTAFALAGAYILLYIWSYVATYGYYGR